jgi:cell division protease FtsH
MVTEFGMSEKLGPLQFGNNNGGQIFLGRDLQNDQNYSDTIAFEIDSEVQRIVKEQYARCKKLLVTYRDKLELMSQTLLEHESLDEGQIQSLWETGKYIEPSKHRYASQPDKKDSGNDEESAAEAKPVSEKTDEVKGTDIKVTLHPKDEEQKGETDTKTDRPGEQKP